jgi:hypothetical protein
MPFPTFPPFPSFPHSAPPAIFPPAYPMSGTADPHARKEPVLNAESTRTRAVSPDSSSSSSRVTRELEADGLVRFVASYAAVVLAGIDAKAGALATQ